MYARRARVIVMLCALHSKCSKLWIKSVGVDLNDILQSSAKVHSSNSLWYVYLFYLKEVLFHKKMADSLSKDEFSLTKFILVTLPSIVTYL